MRKLTIDIETSPNLAVVWGLWRQDIQIKSILEHQDILCWAAKWYDDDEILWSSQFHHGHDKMVYSAWELINDSDAVIHYNGKKFDMPHLNTQFLLGEYSPPAPYHHIDLLDVVRKNFNFASNKLEFVANRLGLGGKADSGGMETWLGCMRNDPDAWDQMVEYNKKDVVLTEQLYDKLLPWIDGHPSEALFSGEEKCACGSTWIIKQGFTLLSTGKYQRFVCNECGKWFRGTKRIDGTTLTEAN